MDSRTVLLCVVILVLRTQGLVQLRNSLAKSESPLLMKILQSIDSATSDEHLLEVTLKLLKSLCTCMRDTLKAKEDKYISDSNLVEPKEDLSTDGKVLDLYKKIYNNTCFTLKEELTKRNNKSSEIPGHPNCGKEYKSNQNGLSNNGEESQAVKNTLRSKLNHILFKALVLTRHHHKYKIKRYNLYNKSKFKVRNSLKHSLIVILTLHPKSKDIFQKKYNVVEEDLHKILHTNSTVEIDIIDTKYDTKDKGSEEFPKSENFTDCHLQSLYTYLTESENKNLTKVFRFLRRRDTIKIYIEVITGRNHTDYINICCKNGTMTPSCKKDSIQNIDSDEDDVTQSKNLNQKTSMEFHSAYKNTITKIEKLVKKLSDKALTNGTNNSSIIVPDVFCNNTCEKKNNTFIDTPIEKHNDTDQGNLTTNGIPNLITETKDSLKLKDVSHAIILLNNFVSKQTTKYYSESPGTTKAYNILTNLSDNQGLVNTPIMEGNTIYETQSDHDRLLDKPYNNQTSVIFAEDNQKFSSTDTSIIGVLTHVTTNNGQDINAFITNTSNTTTQIKMNKDFILPKDVTEKKSVTKIIPDLDDFFTNKTIITFDLATTDMDNEVYKSEFTTDVVTSTSMDNTEENITALTTLTAQIQNTSDALPLDHIIFNDANVTKNTNDIQNYSIGTIKNNIVSNKTDIIHTKANMYTGIITPSDDITIADLTKSVAQNQVTATNKTSGIYNFTKDTVKKIFLLNTTDIIQPKPNEYSGNITSSENITKTEPKKGIASTDTINHSKQSDQSSNEVFPKYDNDLVKKYDNKVIIKAITTTQPKNTIQNRFDVLNLPEESQFENDVLQDLTENILDNENYAEQKTERIVPVDKDVRNNTNESNHHNDSDFNNKLPSSQSNKIDNSSQEYPETSSGLKVQTSKNLIKTTTIEEALYSTNKYTLNSKNKSNENIKPMKAQPDISEISNDVVQISYSEPYITNFSTYGTNISDVLHNVYVTEAITGVANVYTTEPYFQIKAEDINIKPNEQTIALQNQHLKVGSIPPYLQFNNYTVNTSNKSDTIIEKDSILPKPTTMASINHTNHIKPYHEITTDTSNLIKKIKSYEATGIENNEPIHSKKDLPDMFPVTYFTTPMSTILSTNSTKIVIANEPLNDLMALYTDSYDEISDTYTTDNNITVLQNTNKSDTPSFVFNEQMLTTTTSLTLNIDSQFKLTTTTDEKVSDKIETNEPLTSMETDEEDIKINNITESNNFHEETLLHSPIFKRNETIIENSTNFSKTEIFTITTTTPFIDWSKRVTSPLDISTRFENTKSHANTINKINKQNISSHGDIAGPFHSTTANITADITKKLPYLTSLGLHTLTTLQSNNVVNEIITESLRNTTIKPVLQESLNKTVTTTPASVPSTARIVNTKYVPLSYYMDTINVDNANSNENSNMLNSTETNNRFSVKNIMTNSTEKIILEHHQTSTTPNLNWNITSGINQVEVVTPNTAAISMLSNSTESSTTGQSYDYTNTTYSLPKQSNLTFGDGSISFVNITTTLLEPLLTQNLSTAYKGLINTTMKNHFTVLSEDLKMYTTDYKGYSTVPDQKHILIDIPKIEITNVPSKSVKRPNNTKPTKSYHYDPIKSLTTTFSTKAISSTPSILTHATLKTDNLLLNKLTTKKSTEDYREVTIHTYNNVTKPILALELNTKTGTIPNIQTQKKNTYEYNLTNSTFTTEKIKSVSIDDIEYMNKDTNNIHKYTNVTNSISPLEFITNTVSTSNAQTQENNTYGYTLTYSASTTKNLKPVFTDDIYNMNKLDIHKHADVTKTTSPLELTSNETTNIKKQMENIFENSTPTTKNLNPAFTNEIEYINKVDNIHKYANVTKLISPLQFKTNTTSNIEKQTKHIYGNTTPTTKHFNSASADEKEYVSNAYNIHKYTNVTKPITPLQFKTNNLTISISQKQNKNNLTYSTATTKNLESVFTNEIEYINKVDNIHKYSDVTKPISPFEFKSNTTGNIIKQTKNIYENNNTDVTKLTAPVEFITNTTTNIQKQTENIFENSIPITKNLQPASTNEIEYINNADNIHKYTNGTKPIASLKLESNIVTTSNNLTQYKNVYDDTFTYSTSTTKKVKSVFTDKITLKDHLEYVTKIPIGNKHNEITFLPTTNFNIGDEISSKHLDKLTETLAITSNQTQSSAGTVILNSTNNFTSITAVIPNIKQKIKDNVTSQVVKLPTKPNASSLDEITKKVSVAPTNTSNEQTIITKPITYIKTTPPNINVPPISQEKVVTYNDINDLSTVTTSNQNSNNKPVQPNITLLNENLPYVTQVYISNTTNEIVTKIDPFTENTESETVIMITDQTVKTNPTEKSVQSTLIPELEFTSNVNLNNSKTTELDAFQLSIRVGIETDKDGIQFTLLSIDQKPNNISSLKQPIYDKTTSQYHSNLTYMEATTETNSNNSGHVTESDILKDDASEYIDLTRRVNRKQTKNILRKNKVSKPSIKGLGHLKKHQLEYKNVITTPKFKAVPLNPIKHIINKLNPEVKTTTKIVSLPDVTTKNVTIRKTINETALRANFEEVSSQKPSNHSSIKRKHKKIAINPGSLTDQLTMEKIKVLYQLHVQKLKDKNNISDAVDIDKITSYNNSIENTYNDSVIRQLNNTITPSLIKGNYTNKTNSTFEISKNKTFATKTGRSFNNHKILIDEDGKDFNNSSSLFQADDEETQDSLNVNFIHTESDADLDNKMNKGIVNKPLITNNHTHSDNKNRIMEEKTISGNFTSSVETNINEMKGAKNTTLNEEAFDNNFKSIHTQTAEENAAKTTKHHSINSETTSLLLQNNNKLGNNGLTPEKNEETHVTNTTDSYKNNRKIIHNKKRDKIKNVIRNKSTITNVIKKMVKSKKLDFTNLNKTAIIKQLRSKIQQHIENLNKPHKFHTATSTTELGAVIKMPTVRCLSKKHTCENQVTQIHGPQINKPDIETGSDPFHDFRRKLKGPNDELENSLEFFDKTSVTVLSPIEILPVNASIQYNNDFIDLPQINRTRDEKTTSDWFLETNQTDITRASTNEDTVDINRDKETTPTEKNKAMYKKKKQFITINISIPYFKITNSLKKTKSELDITSTKSLNLDVQLNHSLNANMTRDSNVEINYQTSPKETNYDLLVNSTSQTNPSFNIISNNNQTEEIMHLLSADPTGETTINEILKTLAEVQNDFPTAKDANIDSTDSKVISDYDEISSILNVASSNPYVRRHVNVNKKINGSTIQPSKEINVSTPGDPYDQLIDEIDFKLTQYYTDPSLVIDLPHTMDSKSSVGEIITKDISSTTIADNNFKELNTILDTDNQLLYYSTTKDVDRITMESLYVTPKTGLTLFSYEPITKRLRSSGYATTVFNDHNDYANSNENSSTKFTDGLTKELLPRDFKSYNYSTIDAEFEKISYKNSLPEIELPSFSDNKKRIDIITKMSNNSAQNYENEVTKIYNGSNNINTLSTVESYINYVDNGDMATNSILKTDNIFGNHITSHSVKSENAYMPFNASEEVPRIHISNYNSSNSRPLFLQTTQVIKSETNLNITGNININDLSSNNYLNHTKINKMDNPLNNTNISYKKTNTNLPITISELNDRNILNNSTSSLNNNQYTKATKLITTTTNNNTSDMITMAYIRNTTSIDMGQKMTTMNLNDFNTNTNNMVQIHNTIYNNNATTQNEAGTVLNATAVNLTDTVSYEVKNNNSIRKYVSPNVLIATNNNDVTNNMLLPETTTLSLIYTDNANSNILRSQTRTDNEFGILPTLLKNEIIISDNNYKSNITKDYILTTPLQKAYATNIPKLLPRINTTSIGTKRNTITNKIDNEEYFGRLKSPLDGLSSFMETEYIVKPGHQTDRISPTKTKSNENFNEFDSQPHTFTLVNLERTTNAVQLIKEQNKHNISASKHDMKIDKILSYENESTISYVTKMSYSYESHLNDSFETLNLVENSDVPTDSEIIHKISNAVSVNDTMHESSMPDLLLPTMLSNATIITTAQNTISKEVNTADESYNMLKMDFTNSSNITPEINNMDSSQQMINNNSMNIVVSNYVTPFSMTHGSIDSDTISATEIRQKLSITEGDTSDFKKTRPAAKFKNMRKAIIRSNKMNKTVSVAPKRISKVRSKTKLVKTVKKPTINKHPLRGSNTKKLLSSSTVGHKTKPLHQETTNPYTNNIIFQNDKFNLHDDQLTTMTIHAVKTIRIDKLNHSNVINTENENNISVLTPASSVDFNSTKYKSSNEIEKTAQTITLESDNASFKINSTPPTIPKFHENLVTDYSSSDITLNQVMNTFHSTNELNSQHVDIKYPETEFETKSSLDYFSEDSSAASSSLKNISRHEKRTTVFNSVVTDIPINTEILYTTDRFFNDENISAYQSIHETAPQMQFNNVASLNKIQSTNTPLLGPPLKTVQSDHTEDTEMQNVKNTDKIVLTSSSQTVTRIPYPLFEEYTSNSTTIQPSIILNRSPNDTTTSTVPIDNTEGTSIANNNYTSHVQVMSLNGTSANQFVSKIYILDPKSSKTILNRNSPKEKTKPINLQDIINDPLKKLTTENDLKIHIDKQSSNFNNITSNYPIELISTINITEADDNLKIYQTEHKSISDKESKLTKILMLKSKSPNTAIYFPLSHGIQNKQSHKRNTKSIFYLREDDIINQNMSNIINKSGINNSKTRFVINYQDGRKNISYIHTPDITKLIAINNNKVLKNVYRKPTGNKSKQFSENMNKHRLVKPTLILYKDNKDMNNVFTKFVGSSMGRNSVNIYSSRLNRFRGGRKPIGSVTKKIKYNTYQPTTKEDLELINNKVKLQPQPNKSCAVLKTLRHKFASTMEFIEFLKASNCTVNNNRPIFNNIKKNRIIHLPVKLTSNLRIIANTNKNRHPTTAMKKTMLKKLIFSKEAVSSVENTYLLPVNPINAVKKPRRIMKRILLGSRRKEIMTMNTHDFFSQHRLVTQGILRKYLKPRPKLAINRAAVTSIPRISVLRPKFDPLETAVARFDRPKPLYPPAREQPDSFGGDYDSHHNPKGLNWKQKVNSVQEAVTSLPQQTKLMVNNVIDRPYTRTNTHWNPKVFRDRIDSIRNILYKADLVKATRPGSDISLRRPRPLSRSRNLFNPPEFQYNAPKYNYRRSSDGEKSSTKKDDLELAKTRRQRRTIFFLSPTSSYSFENYDSF